MKVIDRYVEDDSKLSTPDVDERQGHDLPLDEQAGCTNLAKYLTGNDLRKIGSELLANFNTDLSSRGMLDENIKNEIDLVMQIAKHKTAPFDGASNVKFPMATIAVLQYMSRANAAIYNNGRLIECRLPSNADKLDPAKRQACKAVEKDLAYELLNEIDTWDEGMRKVFIAQATTGNVFKKIYFNTAARRVQSDVAFLDKLIFDSASKSIETAPRISEITEYSHNDQFSKIATEEWVEMPDCNDEIPDQLTLAEESINERMGIEQSRKTEIDPSQFIEVYTWLDLDNDGYQEPLVITIRRADGAVARIVANFALEDIHRTKQGKLVSISREVTFVKYGFIPSPNDSLYDFGYGRLLFGINAAANTATNQILDIGKWHAAGGGGLIDISLGSQLGGRNKFAPGEYKQAKIMGIDMNKAVWDHPIPNVPPELMAMLNFLVQYSDRISGATDARSGENPGQNTKVGTMDAVIEEGAAIFNGIYRGTRKSFCQEIRAIFKLKKRYFDHIDRTVEEKEIASKAQYDMVVNIDPACAMQYISERDRMKKASVALQTASAFPMAHNLYEVLKDFYDAQDPDTADRYLIHDPKSPNGIPQPGQDPKIATEQGKLQLKQQELQLKAQQIQQEGQLSAQEGQLHAMDTQAGIELKKAQAIAVISGIDDAKIGHKIALLDAIIGLSKSHDEQALKVAQHIHDSTQSSTLGDSNGDKQDTDQGLAGGLGNAGIDPAASGAEGGQGEQGAEGSYT